MWKVLALLLIIPTTVLAQQQPPMPDKPPTLSPEDFAAHKLHGRALWRQLCRPQPPLSPEMQAYAKAFDESDEQNFKRHQRETLGYDIYKQKADAYNAQCAALKAEDEREQKEEEIQRQNHRVRVK